MSETAQRMYWQARARELEADLALVIERLQYITEYSNDHAIVEIAKHLLLKLSEGEGGK